MYIQIITYNVKGSVITPRSHCNHWSLSKKIIFFSLSDLNETGVIDNFV